MQGGKRCSARITAAAEPPCALEFQALEFHEIQRPPFEIEDDPGVVGLHRILGEVPQSHLYGMSAGLADERMGANGYAFKISSPIAGESFMASFSSAASFFSSKEVSSPTVKRGPMASSENEIVARATVSCEKL